MVCDWRNIAGCFDLNTCISSMGRVRPSQEADLPSSVPIGQAVVRALGVGGRRAKPTDLAAPYIQGKYATNGPSDEF